MGPFANQSKLDEAAHEFFRLFSRFEYALKASGFHSGDGDATANWAKFSSAIEQDFCSALACDEEFACAVKYIRNNPPKKQIIQDGQLQWTDTIPQAKGEAELTTLYIRRARNNLFHGGKFNGQWFDPERSELLIGHSITILRKSLPMQPKVYDAYEH